MKKFIFIGIIIILCAIFFACPMPIARDDTQGVRTFWADNLVTNERYQVRAEKILEGTHGVFYKDVNATADPSDVQGISDEFDATIYNLVITNYAEPLNINEDGKIIFLLLDVIDGRGSDPNGYVAGYFSNSDLSLHMAHSNRSSMLFLDTNPGMTGPSIGSPGSRIDENLLPTMAHEMQHMANYSYHLQQGQSKGMDPWIDEGLSTTAEYIYAGKHRDGRISNFRLSETIRNGNTFVVWDEENPAFKDDLLANYSSVYLFFQWLRQQTGGSAAIYKEILESQWTDYRAVVDAARNNNAASLAFTNDYLEDWDLLYSTWLIANAEPTNAAIGYDQSEIGNPLFFSNPAINAPDHSIISKGRITLYPGEAVYTKLIGNPPQDSGIIRYKVYNDYLISYNCSPIVVEPVVPGIAHIAGSFDNPTPYHSQVQSAPAEYTIDARAIGRNLRGNAVSSRIVIKGALVYVGNMPHPELVLRDADGKYWHIDAETQSKFSERANTQVTVEGLPVEENIQIAGGKTLTQWSLKSVVLIN